MFVNLPHTVATCCRTKTTLAHHHHNCVLRIFTRSVGSKPFTPAVKGSLPIEKKTLNFLQGALRAVVTSGTARGSFSGVGVEVSGKTGTGQVFGKNPNGSSKDDTSWFASYAPSKDPQYTVVMMVSQGGFGATTSGYGV
ncbi:MAG: hypothetical protein EB011_03300, partial [Actinobacteria bacterium]|nr:hypothetical protein [Actinomycetota bacterium]